MDLNSHRRPTDKRRIVEAILAARRPLTTAGLAEALHLDIRRVARVVHDLVEENQLEHGPRREDGFSWGVTDVGRRELARMVAAEKGERFTGLTDEDERLVDAIQQRMGP